MSKEKQKLTQNTQYDLRVSQNGDEEMLNDQTLRKQTKIKHKTTLIQKALKKLVNSYKEMRPKLRKATKIILKNGRYERDAKLPTLCTSHRKTQDEYIRIIWLSSPRRVASFGSQTAILPFYHLYFLEFSQI